MRIAGYLSRCKTEARMSGKGSDELGIRFDGDVLTGEKTVEEQLKGDSVLPGGEYYQAVEDYDPVLQAHCRR